MERSPTQERIGVKGGELHRGERIGKYEILTQLTVGGMAELFLAFTRGPGGFRKYVVVKRILPDAQQNEQFVKMFLDEARITAAFSHPNIAQVFDLGEDPDGVYLVMEFIAGQNLNQVTHACGKKQVVMPFGWSISVAHDTALALHYAHTFTDPTGKSLAVIHRDIAQKNVMVTYDGVVKLLDFGIAKARGQLSRTKVGTVKGTTGYMSPEQVKGEALDGRSDVFSVGVMLHELVTGKRLFAADTELEEMRLILTAPIPRPHEVEPMVPRELSDAVMRALARERADRFPSARDLARTLDRVAGHLMFDQEQRAAFMRELFEKKMAATRALLESAEAKGDSQLVDSAVKAIREDAGHVFPEVKQTRERTPSKAADTGVDEEAIKLSAQVETLGNPPAGNRNPVALLIIAVTVAVLGFAVFKVMRPVVAPEPEYDGPPAGLTSAGDLPGPIPQYTGKKTNSPPTGFAPDSPQGSQQASPQPTASKRPAPPAPAKAAPDDGAQAKKPAPRGSGTLTLITTPECTVMRGREVLGQTPLFNAALPAGTHMLTLVGADGKKRLLSAPISANKNTPFRLKLEDLPER